MYSTRGLLMALSSEGRCRGTGLPARSVLPCPDVENDQILVPQDAGEVRGQVAAQEGVVVEPPEGRPPEHHKVRAGPAEALELRDRRRVVAGRAPVLPVPLGEGNGPAAADRVRS